MMTPTSSTRRPPRRWTSRSTIAFAIAASVFALTRCTREAEPDEAPLIRLFDGSHPLEIESPVVFPEQFDRFILGSRPLVSGPFAVLANENGASHPAAPFLEYLGVEAGTVADVDRLQLTLSYLSPVEVASTLVTYDPIVPFRSGEFGFMLETGRAIARDELTDPAKLLDLLREHSRYVSRFGHLSGLRDSLKVGRTITPRVRQGSLVFGVVRGTTDGKAHEPGMLEACILNRRQKWLMDSQLIDPRHPAVRSVALHHVTRPALLLGTGGAGVVEVDLPKTPTKLSTAIAVSMARPDSALEVSVTTTAGSQSQTDHVEIKASTMGWIPLAADLSEFGGKRVRIAFRARALAGTTEQSIVAVSNPLLEEMVESQRKDVILISLDTLRADHSSLYGYSKPTTPNLERLGKRSSVFTRAQSTAPWTLPSHTSILSGLTVDRHGTYSFSGHVPTDIPWLAREFAAAGYHTAAYTGGGFVSPEFGFAIGFDSYGDVDPRHPGTEWIEATANRNEVALASESDRLRAEIVHLLTRPRHAPRFLFLHTYAAHDYRAPPSLLKRLGVKDEEIPALIGAMSSASAQGLVDRSTDPTTLDTRLAQVISIYDASIALADDFLGTVLDGLESAGRLDDTIVIVTSDHGEEILDHGAVGHGSTLYQEQIHVPLVIHAPGLPAGRSDDVVSSVDLAPTLRELAGLHSVGECDGRSLLPALRGETLAPAPAFARGSHRDRVYRAMQGTQFKVITEIDSQLETKRQLFDLLADPREQTDLARQRNELAEELANLLSERATAAQAMAKKAMSTEVNEELDRRLNELGYTARDGD